MGERPQNAGYLYQPDADLHLKGDFSTLLVYIALKYIPMVLFHV